MSASVDDVAFNSIEWIPRIMLMKYINIKTKITFNSIEWILDYAQLKRQLDSLGLSIPLNGFYDIGEGVERHARSFQFH